MNVPTASQELVSLMTKMLTRKGRSEVGQARKTRHTVADKSLSPTPQRDVAPEDGDSSDSNSSQGEQSMCGHISPEHTVEMLPLCLSIPTFSQNDLWVE